MSRTINIQCAECGKEVDVVQRPKFKRKYCDKCSIKKKEEWKDYQENRWKLTLDDMEEDE